MSEMSKWAESAFADWLDEQDLEPDEELRVVLQGAFLAGAREAAGFARESVLQEFCYAPSGNRSEK